MPAHRWAARSNACCHDKNSPLLRVFLLATVARKEGQHQLSRIRSLGVKRQLVVAAAPGVAEPFNVDGAYQYRLAGDEIADLHGILAWLGFRGPAELFDHRRLRRQV